MATVALVLGLVALLGLIPFFGFVTWTIAIPAAILGAVAMRRPFKRGRATAGLILGIGSLVLGLVISASVGAAISGSGDSSSDAAPAAATSDSPIADAVADGDQATSVAAAKAQRASLVSQLEGSIKKDAKKDVDKGLLEGPILDVSCTPAGGSSNALTDESGTFTCFVSTSKDADGTEHGLGYNATINWNSGAYTWQYEG